MMTRQEHLHSLVSSKQEIRPSSYPTLSLEQVDEFIDLVRLGLDIDPGPEGLFYIITIALGVNRDMQSNLVSKEDFLTNFRVHDDFSSLLIKACDEGRPLKTSGLWWLTVSTFSAPQIRYDWFSGALWTVPPFKSQCKALCRAPQRMYR